MGLSRGTVPWLAAILLQAGLAAGCSTAPKRPAEILLLRNQAETQLALVNQAAEQGSYGLALEYMQEARRLAVASDSPSLRIRTELARGNILFFLGRQEEAAAAWQGALTEADEGGEEELAALCRIYQARARLLATAEAPDAIRSRVAGELEAVKANPLSAALGWTVIGLADKEARRWTDAENALKRALEIHEKGRYLEQAAYDWYLIASVRSMAGNYDAALEALFEAVAFDRRSENSWGLAKDWAALGEVYTKAGQADKAAAAIRRSGEIFKSLDVDAAAVRPETRSSASEGP
jgi:tetratricopeptide (TPR) repeat protein